MGYEEAKNAKDRVEKVKNLPDNLEKLAWVIQVMNSGAIKNEQDAKDAISIIWGAAGAGLEATNAGGALLSDTREEMINNARKASHEAVDNISPARREQNIMEYIDRAENGSSSTESKDNERNNIDNDIKNNHESSLGNGSTEKSKRNSNHNSIQQNNRQLPETNSNSFNIGLEEVAIIGRDGKIREEIIGVIYRDKKYDPKDVAESIGKLTPFLINPVAWSKLPRNWFSLFRDMFIRQYDPLTLDLDGDGIETLASNGHKGALFDHDKDGIRTATGWVGKDDGFLVYDRNGDGVVNNGGELFGDNTLLKNGERAANGYQALAELDDNGDGKVDAADSAFAHLRVWRDRNQDGISQKDELLTLEEAKVKAFNLAHQNSDRDLGNGNTLAEEGTYTDSDGNEKQMGDLNLAADHFHSRYADSLPLTDEQQQAPNLRGSGRVRDLREAAAQSPDVAAALQAYANAQTKEEQLALRDQLLRAWAGTDKRFTTEGVLKAASKDFVMAGNGKNRGNAIPLTPGEIRALGTIEGPSIWSLLGIEDPDKKKKAALHEKIGILDAFTGTDSTHLYYGTKAQAQHTLDTIEKTYANLADNLYDGLLFQTRLKPYLNAIRFGMSEDGKLQLDYSGVAALFDEVHAKNPGKAFTDLGELLAKGNADGKNTDMAPLAEKFVQYTQEANSSGMLGAYRTVLGEKLFDSAGHKLGTDDDERLSGNQYANYLYGGKGNDRLYGGEGSDILDGGAGNDLLDGGSKERDTYLFRAGHGKDTVSDYAIEDKDADTLRFSGAKAADSRYRREGYHLIVNAYGENDAVTLNNYFHGDNYQRYNFHFDDATFKAAELRGKDLPTEGLKAPVAATAQADAATPDSAIAAVTPQEKAATATADESKAQAAKMAEKVVEADTFHPPLQLHKDDTASTDAVQKADSATVSGNDAGDNARAAQTPADTKVQSAATDTATQAAVPASGKATQIAAVTSVDSSAASKADTQSATVQQNAESVNAALKTGGAAATPASTLDAKAAQQSQQMLSAMATQSQTATPTALAAPDLQPKPQLVASQV